MAPHKEVVSRIKFSPDGDLVATCSADATVRIWSSADGAEKNAMQGHQAGLSDVAWHPHQKCVATASDDLCARVWDAETGKSLRALRGHSHFLYCCQFNTYGNVLVRSFTGISGVQTALLTLSQVDSEQGQSSGLPSCCDSLTT
jgi:COMPASS component SWD3